MQDWIAECGQHGLCCTPLWSMVFHHPVSYTRVFGRLTEFVHRVGPLANECRSDDMSVAWSHVVRTWLRDDKICKEPRSLMAHRWHFCTWAWRDFHCQRVTSDVLLPGGSVFCASVRPSVCHWWGFQLPWKCICLLSTEMQACRLGLFSKLWCTRQTPLTSSKSFSKNKSQLQQKLFHILSLFNIGFDQIQTEFGNREGLKEELETDLG